MSTVPIATNVQESRAPSPTPSFAIIPPCTAAVATHGPNCGAKMPEELAATAHTPTVASLILKDGTVLQGHSFGAELKSVSGECVFQTGMVGYPESLTDPSYRGQILVLTYPLIGNYGVPSHDEVDPLLNDLPAYFESNQIHIAGLVVGQASAEFSHHLATSSLGDWLKREGVPAIYGVDTRAITKRIREEGVMLGKILFPTTIVGSNDYRAPANSEDEVAALLPDYQNVSWVDPNATNLVAEVSCKEPKLYIPAPETALKRADGKTIRVVAIDIGMKYNQIRCFVKRGVEVLVVPWDYDFLTEAENMDGLFLSNGPGDPTTITVTIERVKKALALKKFPIFGICLGHQVFALASGAETEKMKYGNRGQNIPCTDMLTSRCYITSQNHGYAVKADTLPTNIKELFVNANDGSNEGIYHTELPYFSVQFHPESNPGPRDTEVLFDIFLNTIKRCLESGKIEGPVEFPGTEAAQVRRAQREQWERDLASDDTDKSGRIVNGRRIRKVLVLGSGGLSIGQAGEFDYSGSQAIKALKEEGIYTILINPNIATIQTSKGLADKCYFLPVTPDCVRKVIKHERPDGIYCTFGGQTALNIGVKLRDEFANLGVQVLGTPIETIMVTEDRELFASTMAEINEKCAKSHAANSIEEAIAAANDIGYPLIIRAAYALGGLGSGFASSEEELVALCRKAFAASPQVLVERSMKGWKEIEYEVVRDSYDNCITVCNMENFDPLGIHTGDSIVVAPSQTLSDEDYQMLRTTAVNVIRHLGVVGECNIQYALNPYSREYCIIEVNARLSRSSALASKATGYPLAFVAAKLGLGIPLNEIRNSVTKETTACFEPSLDYIVVKIPRWDLKKFDRVSKNLSSAMKSVGEVMAIGRTFEETMQEAIRSVDTSFDGFCRNIYVPETKEAIEEELTKPTDLRLFAIANALHMGYTVEQIHSLTSIDKWFLCKLRGLVETERRLSTFAADQKIPRDLLCYAKQQGFSDSGIAQFTKRNEMQVRNTRTGYGISPFVKQIDTVAAEFPAYTNYLYITYNASEHDVEFVDNGVMVLGSGVYRIGSSVEFDWCAVRAIRTLRENNFKTIMVNYNPETVSTDYDEADRLYFSNITLERIMDIYEIEASAGVIISMGGQAPNNIALGLHRNKVKIFGTSPENIDGAENRYKFSRMLDQIGVDQPQWRELTQYEDAESFCSEVGYPVLVRPSYVLSGAAMNVVSTSNDLKSYLNQAATMSRDHPVVISKFIEEAKEIDVDAVALDGKLIMHCVSEHVENAGVHSGDATLVQPPQDLDPVTVKKIGDATAAIGQALRVTGPFNIQFMAKNNEIKVIECNVRAARSFPFVSKVTGVDLIEMATKAMLGLPVTPYPNRGQRLNYVGVKVPQFSFSRLQGADPILGVEMASTGEVAAFGRDKYDAYLKAMLATGFQLPKKNILLSIGSYKEKVEMLPSVRRLFESGFKLFATPGTADFIQEHGIDVTALEADSAREGYSMQEYLSNNRIDLYINLPSKNSFRRPASYVSNGYRSRRMAIDFSVPLITNVKCAKMFVEALARFVIDKWEIESVDYITSHRTTVLPGLVNIAALLPSASSENFEDATRAAICGGFTTLGVSAHGADGFAATSDQNVVKVKSAGRGHAHTDYVVEVAATDANPSAVASLSSDAPILYISFDKSHPAHVDKYNTVSEHFKAWPQTSAIVTNASGNDLASTLLLASLFNRQIHITDVRSAEDLDLIELSRTRGLNATCDVSVFTLFADRLPTIDGLSADVQPMWDRLSAIDCFTIGAIPAQVAQTVGIEEVKYASLGYQITLPLLYTAAAEGRLKSSDIVERFCNAPRRIFGLPEQPDTYVEIHQDRLVYVPQNSYDAKWFPALLAKPVRCVVHRVVMRGKTLFLDGNFYSPGAEAAVGRDLGHVLRSMSSGPSGKHFAQLDIGSAGPLGIQKPQQPLQPVTPKSPQKKTVERKTSLASLVKPAIEVDTIDEVDAVVAASPREVVAPAETSVKDVAALVSTRIERPLKTNRLADVLARHGNENPFYMKHVLSVRQFSRDDLHLLFAIAQEMRTAVQRSGMLPLLTGRVMASVFYEPSSRTASSFQAAMLRLGGQVFTASSETSSVAKGETLEDTVRTFGSYADIIGLRHPQPGSVQGAARFANVPVINAGDGTGEHPTQAMLDAFTIREELGTVNGLTITLVGDLKNGRTVHSLARVLSQYKNVTLHYVSPPSLAMPESIKRDVALRAPYVVQIEHTELTDDVLATTDVLYVTRVQKERFNDLEKYEKAKNAFVIDNSVMRKCKRNMIVMHPLPRVSEIAPEVDTDQRAAYFRQMQYGMFVRMALLALVLCRNF
ncbi:Carbamoyl-phosphate synthase [Coemansia spiralis]|uniref:Carbamoyl-phosphate synthase n=2 Tax=Coemansia TaxID=4863 RepID=A0A9W8G252_9FUNG|nr:Carbamoyl-phosphate synthase [Coemansia umbellata]KAJ2619215.1 Carbamoyl-phosphate synthase [Coemansia sp. RSA 1358]KAJ2670451.1 Carbamoyl-phosphate synthase [Coemansia spiralis]